MTLTPPGQAFVTHARMVLGQIEHLRGDMQEYVRGIKGHVRVFANTTSLGEFLPPVLRHYLRRNPDVNIDLRERLSHDIVRAVTEGQTDIGIVAGLVRTENLVTLPYRRDRLVLVVPRGHALDGEMQMAFADTLDLDHVACTNPAPSMPSCARPATSCTGPSSSASQVGNFESACRMIESGVGVGVLPESAASRHAHPWDIAIVPLSDAWSVREMQICVRSPGGPAVLRPGAGGAAGGRRTGPAHAGVAAGQQQPADSRPFSRPGPCPGPAWSVPASI